MSATDLNLASVYQTSATPANYTAGMAIAAGQAYSTGTLVNPQQRAIAVGAKLSVAGTLSLQRYVDNAGLIPQGAPVNLSLQPGIAASVTVGEGVPYLSYAVSITPAAGAAAVLNAFAITLAAGEVNGGAGSIPFAADYLLAEARIHSMQMAALLNDVQSLKKLREDQLTEMGSLASLTTTTIGS